eukprot:5413849-Pyramimonas_sp.AAC.1
MALLRSRSEGPPASWCPRLCWSGRSCLYHPAPHCSANASGERRARPSRGRANIALYWVGGISWRAGPRSS